MVASDLVEEINHCFRC